jgi:hypothetical protein
MPWSIFIRHWVADGISPLTFTAKPAKALRVAKMKKLCAFRRLGKRCYQLAVVA